jgi:hypothetical protein
LCRCAADRVCDAPDLLRCIEVEADLVASVVAWGHSDCCRRQGIARTRRSTIRATRTITSLVSPASRRALSSH